MNRRLVLVFLFAALLASCRSRPEQSAPASEGAPQAAAGPDVAALTGYGRYDEAIRRGEELLQANPEDPKVLRDMAHVYLARVRTQPDQREQLVAQAAHYADRLAHVAAGDPTRLYSAARLFKDIGGMARTDVCPHYARAWQLLVKRGQLMEQGVTGNEGRGGVVAQKQQNKREADDLQAVLDRQRCTY